MAVLYLQRGNFELARSYADRIDPTGQDQAFVQRVRYIKGEIERLMLLNLDPGFVVEAYSESCRRSQEDKPISPNVMLSQALRRMPVGWLNAACRAHGLDPEEHRDRKERARANGPIGTG